MREREESIKKEDEGNCKLGKYIFLLEQSMKQETLISIVPVVIATLHLGLSEVTQSNSHPEPLSLAENFWIFVQFW